MLDLLIGTKCNSALQRRAFSQFDFILGNILEAPLVDLACPLACLFTRAFLQFDFILGNILEALLT